MTRPARAVILSLAFYFLVSIGTLVYLVVTYVVPVQNSLHDAPQSTAAPIARHPEADPRPRIAAVLFPRESGVVDAIARIAPEYNLDPLLVAAIVLVESSGNPRARHSRSGCVGLMQVNVAVWRKVLGLDPARLTEVDYNLRVGCHILRRYLDQVNGDVPAALHCYHSGPHGCAPEYVAKVLEAMR